MNMNAMSYRPLVTVIVPVYDGERFLAEALQSIAVQEYAPLELVVVDDGSTDRSAAVAESFTGVRLLRKPHSGLAATLNHGVRQATGELLAFLDADDRWLPGKLAHQISELAQRPELDMVFGYARQIATRHTADGDEAVALATQQGVHKSSMLVRRSSFWRVGGFSEQADRHDFLDWYARATAIGLQSSVLSEVVFERRIHEHNTGRRFADIQRSQYLSTLRASIQFRRQLTLESAHESHEASD